MAEKMYPNSFVVQNNENIFTGNKTLFNREKLKKIYCKYSGRHFTVQFFLEFYVYCNNSCISQ